MTRPSIELMTSIESLQTLHFKFESIIFCNNFDATLSMINIKEIGFAASVPIADQNTLNTLTKLERAYFHGANLENISPFICRLVNLRMVAIEIFNFDDFEPFFLWSWNEERAKLPNARKVTIYMDDSMYNNMKQIAIAVLTGIWNLLNLDFIELKRFDSIEWNCPFVSKYDF